MGVVVADLVWVWLFGLDGGGVACGDGIDERVEVEGGEVRILRLDEHGIRGVVPERGRMSTTSEQVQQLSHSGSWKSCLGCLHRASMFHFPVSLKGQILGETSALRD